MKTSRSAWLPWAFLVLLISITIASTILVFGRTYTDEFLPAVWPDRFQELVGSLMGGGLVTLILWRRPDNRIGHLLALSTLLPAFSTLLVEYTYFSLVRYPGFFPGGIVSDRLQGALAPQLTAVAALSILLFPTGRLASPRWRWVLWLIVAGSLDFIVLSIISWPTLGFISAIEAMPKADYYDIMFNAGFVMLICGFLLATVSGIQRFRNSRGDERLQLKWIAYGLTLQLVAVIYMVYVQNGGQDFISGWVGGIIGLFGPTSIAIAILKYRLYAIDVVIRRTLVYSVLTAVLALVYYGSVVLVQNLFNTFGIQQSSASIVISTLIIAGLFSPLRRRVQYFIDRRFYRGKYDAEKILAAFSATLRDQVDLDQLSKHLLLIVEESMHPATISLWLQNSKLDSGLIESKNYRDNN